MEYSNYNLSQAIALFRTLDINTVDSKYVKSSEFQVLMIIYNTKKDVCSQDISHYLRCSKVFISKVVNTLIKKELLVKKVNDLDYRKYFLTVTEKGKEIIKTHMDKYMESINFLAKKLQQEKATQLMNLLVESTRILSDYENEKRIK